jgi:Phosphodiester glycosidase
MNVKAVFGGLVAVGGLGLIAYVSWPHLNVAHSLHNRAFATVPAPSFREFRRGIGTMVWQSQDGQSYVTEIDLNTAELRSLTGELPGNGQVGQRSIKQFWQQATEQPGTAQVVINGTFFQTYDQPTGIAFGLKKDDRVVTYGYGLAEFPTLTTTVAWSKNGIAIAPYQRRTFDGKMPNVVGTLDVTAGKNADRNLPRTFIGAKNRRSDGTYQTALFLSSSGARQRDAAKMLKDFGAEQMAMLDGGASTGLVVKGEVVLQPKTKIPQAIGVFGKNQTR